MALATKLFALSRSAAATSVERPVRFATVMTSVSGSILFGMILVWGIPSDMVRMLVVVDGVTMRTWQDRVVACPWMGVSYLLRGLCGHSSE